MDQIVVTAMSGLTRHQSARANLPSKGEGSSPRFADFHHIFVKSYLTGATFRITPEGYGCNHGPVKGYKISIAIPACLIGRNDLLVNRVPGAVSVALAFLHIWLLEQGVAPDVVELFTINKCVINEITPTFLFTMPTIGDAVLLKDKVQVQAEALNNPYQGHDLEKKNSVYTFPPGKGGTDSSLYIKDRSFKVNSYIKTADKLNSFRLPIEDSAIDSQLLNLAFRTLRIEVRVFQSLLSTLGLDKVAAWQTEVDHFETIYALFRAKLRLDEVTAKPGSRTNCLRTNPVRKTLNIEGKLSDSIARVLNDHLHHRHYLESEQVLMRKDKNDRNKFISRCRRDILKEFNIDIKIPWAKQQKELFPELTQLLEYPGEYAPPPEFAPYIFCEQSYYVAYEKLQNRIQELKNRRKGNED